MLVDTGPLVATIDAADELHEPCVNAWRHLREPLLTVWPVITEAMHLVGSPLAQDRLWRVLESRHLQLLPLDARDIPRMRALMSKYSDRPMNLADAALVRVAEREKRGGRRRWWDGVSTGRTRVSADDPGDAAGVSETGGESAPIQSARSANKKKCPDFIEKGLRRQ